MVYQTLRIGPGLYIPDRNIIMLRPRMKAASERSVLAHEIGHHLHGHRRIAGTWSIKQERQADLIAARHLISNDALTTAQRNSRNPADWCLELEVSGEILLAYLQKEHQ